MSVALSVITPVFNGQRHIAETIESVLAQLGANDDYVVVDDGSTDATPAILRRYGERVRVIAQPNAGEAAAVNAGVLAARAPIVGVVNADDPIMPGLLEAMRAAFAADENLHGAYPDWRRIDADGRPIDDRTAPAFDYLTMLAFHLCMPGPGAFFKPGLMDGEPIRDDYARGMTDFDFWLRYGLHNRRIIRLPGLLATWRAHEEGETYKLASHAFAQRRVDVIERLFARADLPDDVPPLRRQALSAAHYNAALMGLRGAGVPSARHAATSFLLAPFWPMGGPKIARRSLTRLAYASLQPFSGGVHDVMSALLPSERRRAAVREQTFGRSASTHR